jgi:hypothetical protein
VVVSVGFEPKGSLADYSWLELKELSRAIAKAGSDAEGLTIAREYRLADKDGRLRGDEKPLARRDGTRTSVRILGFRHDELVGGGKSGISFEFADVPTRHRLNPTRTNAGGWKGSEMRKWLNSEFLAKLPDDLRASIATARKRTNNVGEVARNDARSVTATDDRLWLLSSNEVYGGLPGVYGREGAQYRLYADKGVTARNYGFCKKDGAGSWWWLRSPSAYGSLRFHRVRFDGDWYASYADHDCGVSPGFCL